jgi:transcriptional regulator GlxA family with amidase domain
MKRAVAQGWWVEEVRRLIRERPRISRQELAQSLCISGKRLGRIFKLHTGISPEAYHHRARIEHGARLLRETGRPVKEIADECGFAFESCFCRAFAEDMGMCPLEFRARTRSCAVMQI